MGGGGGGAGGRGARPSLGERVAHLRNRSRWATRSMVASTAKGIHSLDKLDDALQEELSALLLHASGPRKRRLDLFYTHKHSEAVESRARAATRVGAASPNAAMPKRTQYQPTSPRQPSGSPSARVRMSPPARNYGATGAGGVGRDASSLSLSRSTPIGSPTERWLVSSAGGSVYS